MVSDIGVSRFFVFLKKCLTLFIQTRDVDWSPNRLETTVPTSKARKTRRIRRYRCPNQRSGWIRSGRRPKLNRQSMSEFWRPNRHLSRFRKSKMNQWSFGFRMLNRRPFRFRKRSSKCENEKRKMNRQSAYKLRLSGFKMHNSKCKNEQGNMNQQSKFRFGKPNRQLFRFRLRKNKFGKMNQSSIGLRFRFDGGDFGNGIPNIAIQHRRSLEDTRVSEW